MGSLSVHDMRNIRHERIVVKNHNPLASNLVLCHVNDMDRIHPLRKWRKACGLRQKALAKQVKISNSYLCDIELGLSEPSLSLAAKLAKFTGNHVSIADFVLPPRRAKIKAKAT